MLCMEHPRQSCQSVTLLFHVTDILSAVFPTRTFDTPSCSASLDHMFLFLSGCPKTRYFELSYGQNLLNKSKLAKIQSKIGFLIISVIHV